MQQASQHHCSIVEVVMGFDLGLTCKETIHVTGIDHEQESSSGAYYCELSALPLSYPAIHARLRLEVM